MKLRPCVYTGSLTAWRRADGEPALTEGAMRLAYPSKDDREFLEQCAEDGFGVDLEGHAVKPAPKAPKASKRKR